MQEVLTVENPGRSFNRNQITKLAFVTTYNARDIKNWSGTPFYMSKALMNYGFEIDFIGDLKDMPRPSSIARGRSLLYDKILKNRLGKYDVFYEAENLKYIARQVQDRLSQEEVDVIFSPGAIPIAYLETSKPLVMWTDATFAVMYEYYPSYSGLNLRTIRNCHSYERNVHKRLSLAIFSSEWAANSAINQYGVDPSIVKVVPFGANIECHRTVSDINKMNEEKSHNNCKLLFIGQDWYRKGAETAVEVVKEMNNRGIKTELSIVGCYPPSSYQLPDYVTAYGFVDKNNPDGMKLINKLYAESHFFILPTIAECTPIVFSEANSYGLPVITTNTGGISSIIKDEVNGKMFGESINILKCSSYICDHFTDYNTYCNFSLSAFNEYLLNLNWETSIRKVAQLIEKI